MGSCSTLCAGRCVVLMCLHCLAPHSDCYLQCSVSAFCGCLLGMLTLKLCMSICPVSYDGNVSFVVLAVLDKTRP